MDANISNEGYRNGKQPKHAPWGGKDADHLSNDKANKVFPPKEVQPRLKHNVTEEEL